MTLTQPNTGQKRRKLRIGDLLIERKAITEEQLKKALEEQRNSGGKLGELLIQLGFIKEETFLELLSAQLHIPLISLKTFEMNEETVLLLPEQQARHFFAIVLKDLGDSLLLGMVEPSDLFATDELARILKRQIQTALVSERELVEAFDKYYHTNEDISSIAEELGEELKSGDDEDDETVSEADISGAPVVKLLHSIFSDAVHMNASDIHIEPGQKELRIRQRIDGVLHEKVVNEKKIALALISRLKLMSNLDISEKRLPQDGRFNIKISGRGIDVRLSTMPMQYGESVVMRLLDQSKAILDFDTLGMPKHIMDPFRALITRPNGLVLVTGPTGSGKTTTLYTALSSLNTPESKIITCEDPIEYRLPRINQVQINAKIDLTFARVLRTALRQDPDIIMVGEMRDKETSEIGMRAAMTGHFVLSTLHTNDAISTVNRLIDMGAEGYLVATALRAVLAQRLIRRVCHHCCGEHELSDYEKTWLHEKLGDKMNTVKFKEPKGCEECNNTGYKGRIGVYELLIIDEVLGDALRQNDSSLFAKRAKEQEGFRVFTEFALDYAIEGVTTLSEVFRISDGI